MKIKEIFSKPISILKKINFRKIFKNKKSRRIFVIVLAAVVVFCVGLGAFIHSRSTSTKSENITSQVSRGSINNVIEGTGTVEAISQYEISSLAKGDVISDYFEEGDYVEQDQLLYEIDSASLDKNIQKQQTSIEKAQMNYSDAVENVSNLNVRAGISGVITNLYVSQGDNVQSGAKVADVVDRSRLLLTIPFGEDDAENMYAGQSATVKLANSLSTLYGTVNSVGTGTYINSYGVNVTDVEIVVSNPGTVTEGELATATVGNYACYDSGAFKYENSKTVLAETSGEVQTVFKKKGDAVYANDVIVSLYSKDASRNAREAQISLNDATLSLDDLYDDLEDYKIKSPISGKVIQKNIKAGEKMEANSADTMAIVADLSTLTFDISIDELDISSITVGQEVSIEADAMEGKKFTGSVSKISIVGESYQGVTSYPVTVTIDNGEETGLIPGMNVSAQIIVDSVEDVLRVPVSAVRMGGMVIVKDDGSFEDITKTLESSCTSGQGGGENALRANDRMKNMLNNLDIPDGYVAVRVETGLSDGSFIEIKEKDGSLKEGDTILIPDVTATSTNQTQQMQPGMPGGMMPGGGMPRTGGMSGGSMPRTGGMSGGMSRPSGR